MGDQAATDETILEANAAKSKIEELMAKLADLKVEFTKVESIKTSIIGSENKILLKTSDEPCPSTSTTVDVATEIESLGQEGGPANANQKDKPKKKRERNRTKNKNATIAENRVELNVSVENLSSARYKKKDKAVKNHVEVTTTTSKTKPRASVDPSLQVVLTPETVLIYKLLIMPPAERDKFIYTQAKERRILVRNPITNNFDFNPIFYGGSSTGFNGSQNRDDTTCRAEERRVNYERRRLRKELKRNKSKDDKPKSKQDRLFDAFETQVNRLLYGDTKLTDKEKEEAIFLYNVNADKKNKLFSSNENEANLEQFVENLIAKDMGYIVENEIRINQKNNHEGYVTNNINDDGDILIPSIVLRQCALHGDTVKVFAVKPNLVKKSAIKEDHGDVKVISIDTDKNDDGDADEIDENNVILHSEEGVPRKLRFLGFVMKILEKVNTRQCIGTFKKISKTSASTFKPRDLRLPQIKIYPIHMPQSLLNQTESADNTDGGGAQKFEDILYYAKIIDSSHNELIGTIIKPVGKCGELENENEAILLQNGLDPIQYTDEILKEIPTLPFKIPESEFLYREDLRGQCIFTIDPPTARDLDDAVSSKILPNGNYEIGVHISDVSYFLPEKSVIDEKIKTQTTSIYLVDKVYHMLPEKLCFLCSLTPGEDKLAFSVIWEITKSGEILRTEFKRSIINSCSQLSYDHAQAVIDNPEKNFDEAGFPHISNDYKPSDLVEIIKQLNTIALILRQQRFDNGALRINQPKLKFNLNHTTGKPISFYTERQKGSNYLIEDFMLLANQSVAAFIFDKFPDLAVLRKHEPPNQTSLMKLTTKLSRLNLNFDISSSHAIRDSLEKLPKQCKSEEAASSILNFITAKQMTRAKYICSDQIASRDELRHYALSIPIYTHFTSPIRRYPDILVHRLLSAGLHLDKTPTQSAMELNKILKNCNHQKMDAKTAGDDSSNLYFIHYLKSIGSLKLRAAVLEIMEFSMEVILMDTGHILKISYKSRSNKGYLKLKYCLDNNEKPAVFVTSGETMGTKPFILEMFSECLIEVTVNSEKLYGNLIPNEENEIKSTKPDNALLK